MSDAPRDEQGLDLALWIPLALVLGGVALRAAFLMREGVWFDEAWTVDACRMAWPEMLARLRGDLHPQLYHSLAKVFSAALGGATLFTVRLHSLLWGLGAIGLAAWAARQLWGRWRDGLAAAALLAASPMHYHYSVEARMYSMGGATVLAAGVCALLILREAREGRWASGWLLAALPPLVFIATWTHYLAAPMLALLGLLGHFAGPWRGERARGWATRWLGAWCIAGLLVLVLAVDAWSRRDTIVGTSQWMNDPAFAPGLVDLARSVSRSWLAPQDFAILRNVSLELGTGAADFEGHAMDGASALLALWLAWVMWRAEPSLRWIALLVGGVFVLSQMLLFALFFTGVRVFFWPRYASLALPLLAVGAGPAVLRAAEASGRRAVEASVLACWLAGMTAVAGLLRSNQPDFQPLRAFLRERPDVAVVHAIGVGFWPLYEIGAGDARVQLVEFRREPPPAEPGPSYFLIVDTRGYPPLQPGLATLEAVEADPRARVIFDSGFHKLVELPEWTPPEYRAPGD